MNSLRLVKPVKSLPTDSELLAIPRASTGEYELNDKEVRKLRQRIYKLNRDNAAGWRWRTMKEGPYLIVWRIR